MSNPRPADDHPATEQLGATGGFSQLPRPPRPVTRRAARRSWNERTPRVWLILLLLVTATTAFFVVDRVVKASHERRLIQSGRTVFAKLESIESSTVLGRAFSRRDPLPVTLLIPPPEGSSDPPRRVDGRLTGGIDGMVKIGDDLEIRVDPNDPTRWTDRTQPKPWSTELTVAYGLMPLVCLLGVVALLARTRVLNVWRNGQEAIGTVIDATQSAIAPMSRIVRFVLSDSDDNRVYTVLCPADEVPAPGEPIALLYPRGNPGRAIVARLYADA